MQTVVYDGSFDGLLTAIFEVYEYKLMDVHISTKAKMQPGVFAEPHIIITNEEKAGRVISGLKKKYHQVR